MTTSKQQIAVCVYDIVGVCFFVLNFNVPENRGGWAEYGNKGKRGKKFWVGWGWAVVAGGGIILPSGAHRALCEPGS